MSDSPELERLKAARDVEAARTAEAITLRAADDAVVLPLLDELRSQQEAARRRISAAKGRLTRAQRDGSTEAIAAARARLDAAQAAFHAISRAVLAEMQAVLAARSGEHDELLDQMDRSHAAADAVEDHHRRSRPGRQP